VASGGAEPAHFAAIHHPVAAFTVDPPVFAPRQSVTFTAQPSPGARYNWFFGDGTTSIWDRGRRVHHRFPDAEALNLMGETAQAASRVLLRVEDKQGHQDWAAQGVVAVAHWHDATPAAGPTLAGLAWRIFPGEWTQLRS